MIQRILLLIALLVATATNVDGFKFMSKLQPPKILTDQQKVAIAKTEERFGDKSKLQFFLLLYVCIVYLHNYIACIIISTSQTYFLFTL